MTLLTDTALVAHLRQAESIAERLRDRDPRLDVQHELADFRAANRTLLAAAVRASAEPLVFDLSVSGYVRVGPMRDIQTHAHPELAGLTAAWRIHLHGSLSSTLLTAADDFGCTGRRPGGALRARLREAADWLDTVCAEVGELVRPPFISVSDAGNITYTAPARQLVLMAP